MSLALKIHFPGAVLNQIFTSYTLAGCMIYYRDAIYNKYVL